jgi:hypothetical protein
MSMMFMKDPKKMSAMVLDHLGEKKPETSDGAVKDAQPAFDEQGDRMFKAFTSGDSKSFMSLLKDFMRTYKDESKDEKPTVTVERI